jgi:hypothetical protein
VKTNNVTLLASILKKCIYTFSISIVCAVVASCATNPLGNYKNYKGEINEIACGRTYAHVEVISNSGGEFNPLISLKTEGDINAALIENLKGKIRISYTDTRNMPYSYEKILQNLFISLRDNKDTYFIKRLPWLIDYMKTRPERYFIFIYNYGFTRTKANMASSVAGDALIGIATLGLFVPYPIKSTSDLYFCIIDKVKCEVIYYKYDHVESDPTDYEVLYRQLDYILEELKKL